MFPIAVSATDEDLIRAAAVAALWQAENVNAEAYHNAPTSPKAAMQLAYLGAVGELIGAKGLGRYWKGKSNKKREADLGGRDQARATDLPRGSLILHPWDPVKKRGDKDDDIFFLIIRSTASSYYMMGWMLGSAGKQPCYWREKGVRSPAYFVPQSALNRTPPPGWRREARKPVPYFDTDEECPDGLAWAFMGLGLDGYAAYSRSSGTGDRV